MDTSTLASGRAEAVTDGLGPQRSLVRAACVVASCLIAFHAHAQQPVPAAAATTQYPHGPGSLTGLWTNADYKFTGGFSARQRAIRTTDGKAPPFLPAAATLLNKRLDEADKQGKIFANTLANCLPGGVPEMLFGAAYLTQVLETPGQITVLYEEQNHFRIIRLDQPHLKDPDPSYMGDSVGHWDGDTLVVDTIGLSAKTTLDMVGTPHTDAMHVVERYRRTAPDKIQIQVSIDDKGTFARPWDAKVTYKAAPPGSRISEYICENNHNGADQNGFQTFGPPPAQ